MSSGTITRRMEVVLSGLEDEFKSLYDADDFTGKLNELIGSKKSRRPTVLNELFEMFDAYGIDYERGRENDYYEDLIKDSVLPTVEDVEDRMMLTLFNRYKEYPSPEQYMLRIVDKMSGKNERWESDTLRVRILKRFIKYGNYLTGKCGEYGGRKYIRDRFKAETGIDPKDENIISWEDENTFNLDSLFNVLTEAKEEDLRPSGSYGLLKAIDDIASGKFRTQGATKKFLYLFAMVYGMTYKTAVNTNPDAELAEDVFDSDIEKNLFRDYYTNNLIRFITSEYKGNLPNFELNPSGQGINYKNFAEAVYVYYIASKLAPAEKLIRSNAMIERLKKLQTDNSGEMQGNNESKTVVARSLFQNENEFEFDGVLYFSEEEFEIFIADHYDCRTRVEGANGKGSYSKGPIQIENEQNTAFEIYRSLREKLVARLGEIDLSLENCNYGLWFTDVSAFKKKSLENICDRHPEKISREKFQKFLDLLLAVNSFLGNTVDEDESDQNISEERTALSIMKTRALYVENPAEITRTDIVVAYYYYYNALHFGEEQWRNFREVWDSFKTGIDKYLEEAFYQTFDGKNILDVLVAFSAYAYLNV